MKPLLPEWVGRVAAIALLLGVGLTVHGTIIGPLIAAYEKDDRDLVDTSELLVRYQTIAQSRGRLQADLQSLQPVRLRTKTNSAQFDRNSR